MIATPDMPQHLQAFAKANHVRVARAAMHDQIGTLPTPAGFKRVAELLEDPPEIIGTLEIRDLLKWVFRIGNSHARSILMHADQVGGPISENRQIRELTERQRFVLADHLYEKYSRGRS